jgi:Flp pilus assembly protein TadD
MEQKLAAQAYLEQGDAPAAIQRGERSVRLDPGDADAWLILGAAYMQRGASGQARRCFSSCVQLARRGAKSECAALLGR